MRAMCGVQLKYRKRSMELMLMLHLHETIYQLAIANSVHLYDHVLRRALDFEFEGQRMKGRLKRTWKSRLRKNVWRLV